MQQAVAIAGGRFEGMSEGMAQIEQGTLAGFSFVARYDAGFGFAATGDRAGELGTVSGHHPAAVGFEPFEQRPVAEQTVFHHLGVAGAQLAGRQRVEQRGVGEYRHGLMKRADQVLAERRIDAGLAADRAIHLGKQGGRDLDQRNPATQDCGSEAGQVTDHAAAECQDGVVPLDAGAEQSVAQLGELGEALAGLSGRQHDGVMNDGRSGEARLQLRKMQSGNRGIGHDGDFGPRQQRQKPGADFIGQVRTDGDIVAAPRQRHADGCARAGGHDGPLWVAVRAWIEMARITSETILVCGTSRLSTVMVAWE